MRIQFKARIAVFLILLLSCNHALSADSAPTATNANTPANTKTTIPKLKLPVQTKESVVPRRVQTSAAVVPNTLLIMPNSKDADDALSKVREVNGTIVRTIGRGALTTWVVQFENQETFLKAEKELSKDAHV